MAFPIRIGASGPETTMSPTVMPTGAEHVALAVNIVQKRDP